MALVLVNDDVTRAWDRQKFDSHKSWRAFVIFRDAGANRTLIAVAREIRKQDKDSSPQPCPENVPSVPEKPETIIEHTRLYAGIKKWNVRHHWQERVRLFDIWQDRQQAAVKNAQIKEMNVRHANIAVLAQQKVIQRLRSMTDAEVREMDLRDILEIAKMAVAIERTARGEPEVITQGSLEIKSEHTERHEIVLSVKDILKKLPLEHVLALEDMLGKERQEPIIVPVEAIESTEVQGQKEHPGTCDAGSIQADHGDSAAQ